MGGAHAHRQNLSSQHDQLVAQCAPNDRPPIRSYKDWLLFEKPMTSCQFVNVHAGGWRVFVVAGNVLSMVAGAKAARVAMEPIAVGMSGDAEPRAIVGGHCLLLCVSAVKPRD